MRGREMHSLHDGPKRVVCVGIRVRRSVHDGAAHPLERLVELTLLVGDPRPSPGAPISTLEPSKNGFRQRIGVRKLDLDCAAPTLLPSAAGGTAIRRGEVVHMGRPLERSHQRWGLHAAVAGKIVGFCFRRRNVEGCHHVGIQVASIVATSGPRGPRARCLIPQVEIRIELIRLPCVNVPELHRQEGAE